MAAARAKWTKRMENKLIKLYPNTRAIDIANELGLTRCQVYFKANQLGLKKPKEWWENEKSGGFKKGHQGGFAYQFKKGIPPYNKGKKMEEFMDPETINKIKMTQFKKGHKPHNTKQDGKISIRYHKRDKTSTQWIRIKENEWIPLHYKVWSEAYGPIPKGMVVRFKDNNTMNVELDNLELITNKENMIRNSIHTNYPEDIKQAIFKLGHLKRIINGKKQNN